MLLARLLIGVGNGLIEAVFYAYYVDFGMVAFRCLLGLKSTLKKLFLISLFLIAVLLVGFKGEQGPVGPKGVTGAMGAAGTNAAQPLVYDFAQDTSIASSYFAFPKGNALVLRLLKSTPFLIIAEINPQTNGQPGKQPDPRIER